jgi:uncharacterized protein YerC
MRPINETNQELQGLLEKGSKRDIVTETQPELPKMSYFVAPITNTTPFTSINIIELHKKITSDENLKKTCEIIRNRNKVMQKELKSTRLDYITPSGIFQKRDSKSIVMHTGYLCIDFDNLFDDEIEDLKPRIISDPNIPTHLLFLSPTGMGLKWIIGIEANAKRHGLYFDAVCKYIQNTYQRTPDKSGKDVVRACFLSHDKNAYLNSNQKLNPLDETFLETWLFPKASKPTSSLLQPVEQPAQSNKLEQVNRLLDLIIQSEEDITSDYHSWVQVGFALCELGEDGRAPFQKISSFHPEYDEVVCDDKYDALLSSYDGQITLGTLFYIAKQHGVEIGVSNTPIKPSTAVKIPTLKPRTASQRLSDAVNQAEIKPLLGSIWQTGELHILFADTGAGKSVWATQIADSLSKGKSVLPVLPNQNNPLKVLFYDFELSDKQFQKRYTNEQGKTYSFNDNFYIDNINFQHLLDTNPDIHLDDLVINKIEADIQDIKPEVLIIDNLTYLKTESTQETGVALALIRRLNNLKRKYGLSMLILAHTPKLKDGNLITLNELGGSKHLSNFVDSVSAIGKSTKGASIRYIKQVKPSRSAELIFDYSNVIATELKLNDCFLGFEYMDCENEYEHIRKALGEEKSQRQLEQKMMVIDLHEQGKSIRAIQEITGIPKSTVGAWIKNTLPF